MPDSRDNYRHDQAGEKQLPEFSADIEEKESDRDGVLWQTHFALNAPAKPNAVPEAKGKRFISHDQGFRLAGPARPARRWMISPSDKENNAERDRRASTGLLGTCTNPSVAADSVML